MPRLHRMDPECRGQHGVVRHQRGCLTLVRAHTCVLEPLRERLESRIIVERVEGTRRGEVEGGFGNRARSEHALEQRNVSRLVFSDMLEDWKVGRGYQSAGSEARLI